MNQTEMLSVQLLEATRDFWREEAETFAAQRDEARVALSVCMKARQRAIEERDRARDLACLLEARIVGIAGTLGPGDLDAELAKWHMAEGGIYSVTTEAPSV